MHTYMHTYIHTYMIDGQAGRQTKGQIRDGWIIKWVDRQT
jgi:hypothetical protein